MRYTPIQIITIPTNRMAERDSPKKRQPTRATTTYPILSNGYAKLTSTLDRTTIQSITLAA